MRNILTIALLLLAATPVGGVAATLPANAEYSIHLTGNIEIAPDGSVHAYALDDGLKPAVEQLVAASIQRWKFEPILVDGRAVIAKTRLRMTLDAVPTAEGYALEVDNVSFGEPSRSLQMNPPSYPRDAASSGVGARVVLVLRIDAAGNVVEAHPEQTSLSKKVPGKTMDRWSRLFEKTSIAAASQWKFDVPEIIDSARAESTTVRVPVTFMMGAARSPQWLGFIPGPVVPAPWVDVQHARAVASASDALADGEIQALNSRFKLQTEVIGTVL